MYKTIKSVIESGRYELSDMLKKIDSQWLQGSITEEERTELTALAQDKADVNNSIDVLKKLEELDKRVAELEKAGTLLPDEEEYPEYVPGKWYYAGNKMTFESEHYECIAPEGQVCTWSPKEYPPYWKKI